MRPVFVLCILALGCSGAPPADPTPAPATGDPAASDPTASDPTSAATADPDFVPPPYDYDLLPAAEHDDVCTHTGEPPSPDTCTTDTDCRICHDGSNCGVPVNIDSLRTRGAACTQRDAAACEYAAVRCCSDHCRVVSH